MSAVPLNEWTHLAGTWDGSTATLYVNGKSACSFPRLINLGLPRDTTPLIIGGNAHTSADEATENFNGLLDEVAIYRRALSATEILRLM